MGAMRVKTRERESLGQCCPVGSYLGCYKQKSERRQRFRKIALAEV